ncbi:hypothetical protein OROGR_032129 [Orobanche gracilis]
MVPLWRRKKFRHTEKSPRNGSVWHFSSNLDVPNNVVQKKRLARVLFFIIRQFQEILKIRDGSGRNFDIHKKSPRNGSVSHFYSNLDVPNNVVEKKRVAQILFFKIRPFQEILKIRDGTPLEAEEISTYRKKPSKWIEILKIRDGSGRNFDIHKQSPRNGSISHFYSNLDVPNNVVEKKRVTRILFFKIRPFQEILKIRDGTPLEAEEISTYRKKPSKWIEILKIRDVARILFFKIRQFQEILKIRDGSGRNFDIHKKSPRNGSVSHFYSNLDVPNNVVEKKRVARILFFKIRPFQEILKIRDGTPLEAEEISTYRKSPRNGSVWHFSSNLDVPNNVVQKKRLTRVLFFKIRPFQEILKIRDEILKIRDGSGRNFDIHKKSPRNGSVSHFYSNLDVPNNVVEKKRVERILFFKIRPFQEILKIRDGTPLEAEEISTYRKKPSKWIGLALF